MPGESTSTEQELAYQAQRATQIDVRPTPPHIFKRYRKTRLWRLFPKEYLFRSLGDLRGRSVLDFGCGEGTVSTQLAFLGARVTGIDISPELIGIARRRAELDGHSERVEFRVGDIAELSGLDARFDVVLCNAVLHHVDISSTLPRLLAAVKPGGMLAAVEPIAFWPTLRALRDRLPLPTDASPGERPLSRQDVRHITDNLAMPRLAFFRLFGRLARLFPNASRIDRGYPLTKAALITLTALDRALLSLAPPLAGLAGQVVIRGRKPEG